MHRKSLKYKTWIFESFLEPAMIFLGPFGTEMTYLGWSVIYLWSRAQCAPPPYTLPPQTPHLTLFFKEGEPKSWFKVQRLFIILLVPQNNLLDNVVSKHNTLDLSLAKMIYWEYEPVHRVAKNSCKCTECPEKNGPQFLLNFSGCKHARGLGHNSLERWDP